MEISKDFMSVKLEHSSLYAFDTECSINHINLKHFGIKEKRAVKLWASHLKLLTAKYYQFLC